MVAPKNRVGQKFGDLVVIAETDKRDKSRSKIVICQCVCGNVIERPVKALVAVKNRGGTSHCGCRPALNRKPRGYSTRTQLFNANKNRAKTRGIPWNLSKEKAYDLYEQNCYYCGSPPSQVRKVYACQRLRMDGEFIFNGIDRVDNSQGYNSDNVVACCWTCNRMKHATSQADFIAHVHRIVEHQRTIQERSR